MCARSLSPDVDYFDLINQRLGISFLRTWDWHKLLTEYMRILKPGGVIRITESEMSGDSTSSPALNRFYQFMIAAFYQSGHLFNEQGSSVIQELEPLLQRHGLQEVQM